MLSTGFIATLTVLYYFSYHQSKQLQRHQKQGLHAIAALLETMRLLKQHRGLTSRYLSAGHTSKLQLQLQEKHKAIDNKLTAIGLSFSSSMPFFNSHRWQVFSRDWGKLSGQWRDLQPLDNINSHCQLLKQLLEAIPVIATQSHLDCKSADNRLYYLLKSAPQLLEKIARFRTLSVHALSHSGQPDDELTQQVIELGLTINKELVNLSNGGDIAKNCHNKINTITRAVSSNLAENVDAGPEINDIYEQTSDVIDDIVANVRYQLIKAGRENITD
jgi:hypothetical protein